MTVITGVGTGIYVYLILANNVAPGITTLTNCNFTLDGKLVGTFRHNPTTSTALQYNASALAYANNSLSNSNHKLSIVTAGPDSVLVVFDYALYTLVFVSFFLKCPFIDSYYTGSTTP